MTDKELFDNCLLYDNQKYTYNKKDGQYLVMNCLERGVTELIIDGTIKKFKDGDWYDI